VKLSDVMTVTEAAAEWGFDPSTLRYACIGGKFSTNEARKSGGTWLITRQAMKRVYGEPSTTK
jgi:hypothetical protein